jgi:hypothetical protein
MISAAKKDNKNGIGLVHVGSFQLAQFKHHL